MARTSSVNQANRSWRGEGDRPRHMKNPEAATPRIRQHRLAEKPWLASSAMTGYLALGAPLLKQLRGLLDQGQFSLQLLDPLSGRRQFPALAGRDARLHSTVDLVLGFPPVHGRLGQPQ